VRSCELTFRADFTNWTSPFCAILLFTVAFPLSLLPLYSLVTITSYLPSTLATIAAVALSFSRRNFSFALIRLRNLFSARRSGRTGFSSSTMFHCFREVSIALFLLEVVSLTYFVIDIGAERRFRSLRGYFTIRYDHFYFAIPDLIQGRVNEYFHSFALATSLFRVFYDRYLPYSRLRILWCRRL